jgi:hypothetical protein
MAATAKIYGFSLTVEDDARLEHLREAFGWTRSAVIRELLKGARIKSRAEVQVELQESDGDDAA